MQNLNRAVAELLSEQRILEQQLKKLKRAVGVLRGLSGGQRASRPRRKMSAKGRARIAAAQRARWAKWKAGQKK